MRVKLPLTLPILLLFILLIPVESSAQFSFTALEGLPAARKMAIDSLGSDAELISITTVGEIDMDGLPLSFDLETGEAMVWVYLYRESDNNELFSVAVLRLFAYQAISGGSVPLPTFGEYEPITTTGPYADSDAMVGRLNGNGTYMKYRADLPGNQPGFITLGEIDPNGTPLPDEIPIGQSIWLVSFSGMGDSSMTCFVGSTDGATFCLRAPSMSVVDADRTGSQKSMRLVGQNPVRRGESLKVVLDGEANYSTDSELLLFNSIGESVGDFTQSLRDAGRSATAIQIETSHLSPGSYHLILRTPTGAEHVGLIVR